MLRTLIVIGFIIGETGTKPGGKVLTRLTDLSCLGNAQRIICDLSRSFAELRLPENGAGGDVSSAELPLLLQPLGAQFAVVQDFATGDADIAQHLEDMPAWSRGGERHRKHSGH